MAGVISEKPAAEIGPGEIHELAFSPQTAGVTFAIFRSPRSASNAMAVALARVARVQVPDEPNTVNPSLCYDIECIQLYGRVIVDGADIPGAPEQDVPALKIASFGARWLEAKYPDFNADTIPPRQPRREAVFSQSGSGITNTNPFRIKDSWRLHYSFDCANFGQSGNFAADIETSRGNPVLSDTGPNLLQLRGEGSSYEPRGGRVFISINSECDWTVSALGRP